MKIIFEVITIHKPDSRGLKGVVLYPKQGGYLTDGKTTVPINDNIPGSRKDKQEIGFYCSINMSIPPVLYEKFDLGKEIEVEMKFEDQ